MSGRGSGAFVLCPALELPELVLDGHLPLGRPPLHVAVLQDELPQCDLCRRVFCLCSLGVL